jgi:hypothetical protein
MLVYTENLTVSRNSPNLSEFVSVKLSNCFTGGILNRVGAQMILTAVSPYPAKHRSSGGPLRGLCVHQRQCTERHVTHVKPGSKTKVRSCISASERILSSLTQKWQPSDAPPLQSSAQPPQYEPAHTARFIHTHTNSHWCETLLILILTT